MKSYLCLHCNKPILAPERTNTVNHWMGAIAAIGSGGELLTGEYTGEGTAETNTGFMEVPEGASVYHTKCWIYNGMPGFSKASQPAPDDGYSFEDGAYDYATPEAAKSAKKSTQSANQLKSELKKAEEEVAELQSERSELSAQLAKALELVEQQQQTIEALKKSKQKLEVELGEFSATLAGIKHSTVEAHENTVAYFKTVEMLVDKLKVD